MMPAHLWVPLSLLAGGAYGMIAYKHGWTAVIFLVGVATIAGIWLYMVDRVWDWLFSEDPEEPWPDAPTDGFYNPK